MKLPLYVKTAINLLEKSGYEVYVVGGAVRDYLLGNIPHDFDLSTNATPIEAKEVFKNYFTIDTGLKHGTISVMINNELLEITTYRYEEEYDDFRRPNNVHFIKNIEEDLARRDFTINSIAYNKKIIDVNGGVEDLHNKIIRAIGDPLKRFIEDPLRILRALRFASVLNFEIETNTKKALISNFYMLEKVSKERINNEFSRLILGINAKNILSEYSKLIEKHILKFNLSEVLIASSILLPVDLNIRLACLCLELSSEEANNKLTDLKYSRKQIKDILLIINNYYVKIEASEISFLKLLKTVDYETIGKIINIRKAILKVEDKSLNEIQNIEYIYKSLKNKYLTIKDLKINGNDLIKLGYIEGIEIRIVLEKLLDDCLNGLLNEHSVLVKKAEEYLKQNRIEGK